MDIKDILLHDETIFKDINAFNPDYVPENYKYRDSQMESLAICIRPALKEGRPVNAVILGSCATGKTTAIKKIFEMVENSSEQVICCYINCQLHITRFGIFSQIYNKIFGHYPPETGVPFSRIYQKIMQYLQSEKKALIIALDDVNYLFHSKNANKIFYDVLRAYEEFPGVRTGIFAVLSDIEFRHTLDKNVNSVFIPQEIVFSPYTRNQMFDILKERVKIGFYPNVISDEILEQITDYASENGDLRIGIDLLRISGNRAEAEASRNVKVKHLGEALKSSGPLNLINILKSLSKPEYELLEMISNADEEFLRAGELYEVFKKKNKSSYSSFNRILEKLEFLRLIDTKFTGKGIRGNSRLIILRFSQKEINKCMALL